MSRSAEPAAPGAFAHVTVGVARLDEAVAFWTDNFGLEVCARREGPDAPLAALWDIAASDIAAQALLRTPTARAGALHLVEFRAPAAPVRRDARTFDHLPKNLDLYARDLQARFAELSTRGIRFRSDPVTAAGPDGMTFREVHLHAHDDMNVVLLEVVGEGYDTCFNSSGFAGIGPLVTIVPDMQVEDHFYRDLLGMSVTLDLRLGGPDMERMIGLPPGAALSLKVYGDPLEPLGRIEVIEYERMQGENRHARARPPALGTLHATWRLPSLAPLEERLARGGVAVRDHGVLGLLYGTGRVVSFCSPAGFRLEVQENAPFA